jgi:FKBP-type peptidyl-prolyl cis-trans isomerase SlpA
VIQKNSIVTMHFTVRLKDGSVAESTRTVGQPMQFHMDGDFFSEKLRQQLLGLEVGAKPKIMLLPEDAFGEAHPANVYQVPRQQFLRADLDHPLEVGLIVSFMQPNGVELPGIIRALDTDEVTVDFNHPLAGQVLLFEIEIIDIQQP